MSQNLPSVSALTSENTNKLVEIIVLKYNNPEYEHDTIRQVLETVTMPYHLTAYENFQHDDHVSAAWNKLIRRTDAPYVCLLNSDTVPTGNWLEQLMGTFDEYENVGAVGPISNCAGGHQGGHVKAMQDGTTKECHDLSGFCLLFPREAWEKIGGFDEAYHLYGEDSDLCYRLRKAGYKLITRFDTFVYHYGHKTMELVAAPIKGKDVEEIQKESARRFRDSK